MRILELYLQNYIGIYSGLGLNEIRIDFSKCKHNITMLVGDNGCGKSTIMRALSPLPDGNMAFINGASAQKVITYIDDIGTIFRIRYVHEFKDGKRITTKGFIEKTINGEVVQLNPNGNVSSCKDILYTELGLDSNFVSLSEIGCENRGLATKKPAERKQYINYILNDLEVYNSIYKTLNKRSGVFKSMINSITSKIAKIGDLQSISNLLASANQQLYKLNTEKDNLVAAISEAKTSINLLDPDHKIQDRAKDIKMQLKEAEIETNHTKKSVDSLMKSFGKQLTKIDELGEKINRSLVEEELAIDSVKSKINDITDSIEAENKLLMERQAKLSKFQSDKIYEEVKFEYDSLGTDIIAYEKILDDMGLQNRNISSAELITGIRAIKDITDDITILKESFDYEIINLTLESTSVPDTVAESLANKLAKTDAEITFIEAELSNLEILSKRPDKCNLDKCPFIAKAVSISKKDYPYKLERLKESRNAIADNLNKAKQIVACSKYVENIKSSISKTAIILTKLPGGEVFSDVNVLFKNFFNGNTFQEARRIVTFIDMANTVDLYNDATRYRSELEKDLQEFKYKQHIIDDLVSDIERLNTELSKKTSNLSEYNAELCIHRSNLLIAQEAKTNFDALQTALEAYSEASNRKKSLEEEQSSITTVMDKINDLISQYNTYNNKLVEVNNSIGPIIKGRDDLLYSQKQLEEYSKELQEYQASYDKIETIKYYSSPTTGIQLVFLSLYMNKILSIANDLLEVMFNGELEILPFVINESEFKIPCVSRGSIPCDDVTSMSNSQICMISTVIQFALLFHSSTKLNIPRLDEIDCGLDSFNRIQFVKFVDQLMSNLNMSQAILISQTSELLLKDVDIIMLKNTNCQKEVSGNIIYQY